MKWKNIFDKFKDNKILIVGDIMLDTYLIGKVERISPEAPVPVVDIHNKIDKLGGAANVALNIKELGATPIICSVIGADQNGWVLKATIKNNGMETKYLKDTDTRKTTNKIRVIGNNAQMIRIDEETKQDITDEIYDRFKENIIIAVAENRIDGIIIQDYDKGVVSPKLIDYLTALSKKRNVPLFIDPKLRNFDHYKSSTIFKPNFNELKRGLKDENLCIEKWEEVIVRVESLMKERDIETFYTTLGDRGILLSTKINEEILHHHIEGEKRSVADVSGAGDTVISVAALLTINENKKSSKKEQFETKINTAKIANIAGGIVCEKVGVVPIDKEELLKEIVNL